MDLKGIKESGRVSVTDVIEAAGEIKVSLITGTYHDCANGMCPMEAVAVAGGLTNSHMLLTNGVLSEAYQVAYIREYDGSGHSDLTVCTLRDQPGYAAGISDGADMREHLATLELSGDG